MFYLLSKHREPGIISQQQLISLRLLPGLIDSVGILRLIFCSKYLLVIGNKGKMNKMPAKESIYFTKKSDSRLCEIYQEEDKLWNINSPDY